MAGVSSFFSHFYYLNLACFGSNCKKLDTPSEKSLLKIFVEMGIDFNDEKTDQGNPYADRF